MTNKRKHRKSSNSSQDNAGDQCYVLKKKWGSTAEKLLLDRTIVGIRYLTDGETERSGWISSPVAFTLDDGTVFFPMSDDEGNAAGAIYLARSDGARTVLPVV